MTLALKQSESASKGLRRLFRRELMKTEQPRTLPPAAATKTRA
jgi:hypothetical protein